MAVPGKTEEELEREIYKETFEKFDKDKNGFINMKELETVLNELGQKFTQKDLDCFINAVDKDKNGTIDFEEFSSHLSTIRRKGFKEMDLDGDGLLTPDEVVKLYASFGVNVTLQFARNEIARDDTNNDGVITYIEFVKSMKNNPLQI